MDTSSRQAVESARGQFDSTLQMLRTFVLVCPDTVWESCYYQFPYPVWYQVYHAAFFIDYWFRDTYDGSDYKTMAFDERIPPEYEHEVDPSLKVSRVDMLMYLAKLQEKAKRFFDRLNDEKLGMTIESGENKSTYADVVFSQIRHVMYNVGYLNGILRSLGLPESDWYAYNEEE